MVGQYSSLGVSRYLAFCLPKLTWRLQYYLSDILKMIGRTSSIFFQKLNLCLTCWNLVVAVAAASCVAKFKRRPMYLTCTISLLLCYVAWTVSMEETMKALKSKTVNNSAGVATIFFIFMYAPCAYHHSFLSLPAN